MVQQAQGIRRRSSAVAGGMLLLWCSMRMAALLEGWLYPVLSPLGLSVLELILYCAKMMLPLWGTCRLLGDGTAALLPLRRGSGGSLWLLPLALGAMMLLNLPGNAINAWLGERFLLPTATPSLSSTPAALAVDLFAMTLCPAVLEELLFRGAVLQGLRPAGERTALVLSALFFMVSHSAPAQWIPAFGAGLLFGWMALATGTLRWGILAHFVYNLFTALSILSDSAFLHFWLPVVFLLAGIIAVWQLFRQGLFRCRLMRGARTRWLTLPLLFSFLLLASNMLLSLQPLT